MRYPSAKTSHDIPKHLIEYHVAYKKGRYRASDSVFPFTTPSHSKWTDYPFDALEDHVNHITEYLVDVQFDPNKSAQWEMYRRKFGWNIPKTLWQSLTVRDKTPTPHNYDTMLSVLFSIYHENDNRWPVRFVGGCNPPSWDHVRAVAENLWNAEGPHTMTRSDDSYSTWTEPMSWHNVSNKEHYYDLAYSQITPERDKDHVQTPIYTLRRLLEWKSANEDDFNKLSEYYRNRTEEVNNAKDDEGSHVNHSEHKL